MSRKKLQKLLDHGGTSVGQLHSLYAMEAKVVPRGDLPKDSQGRG